MRKTALTIINSQWTESPPVTRTMQLAQNMYNDTWCRCAQINWVKIHTQSDDLVQINALSYVFLLLFYWQVVVCILVVSQVQHYIFSSFLMALSPRKSLFPISRTLEVISIPLRSTKVTTQSIIHCVWNCNHNYTREEQWIFILPYTWYIDLPIHVNPWR